MIARGETMAAPTAPDVSIEDLLKIIGDKEVQLARQSAHIKALAEKVMELEGEKVDGKSKA